MIQTQETVVIIQHNKSQHNRVIVRSRITETITRRHDERFEIQFEDYYIVDEVDVVIRSDVFSISFEEYDQLLQSLGWSITSKQSEKNILAQAHAIINNRDEVYWVEREVLS